MHIYFPYRIKIYVDEIEMIEHLEKPYKPEQIKHILNPIIDKWFFTRFKEFSLPQLFGVMEIHSRNNILVSAPTGATKTLTAFLSILNELIDSSEKGILENRVYCVYVSPLKALSNDIHVNLVEPLKEMEKIAGKKLNIRAAVRTGDTLASEKAKMLKHPPHILITTPESLAIMLSSIKFRELLKNIEWLIVDEVHALAENKRGVHLSLSMERLNMISPAMTRIGLSATIAPLEEIARFLAGYEKGKLRNCKIVDVQFIKSILGLYKLPDPAVLFLILMLATWALSALLAIALLMGGLMVLMLDLGRPDRLIVAMTHFNFKSIFAMNIFLYSGFVGFVVAYLWTMMERRMNRFTPLAGFMAFIWRMALTTGTGSIFGFLVARQAYDSALLAPLSSAAEMRPPSSSRGTTEGSRSCCGS